MKRVLIMDWDPHAEKYFHFFLFQENTLVQVWDHAEGEKVSVPSGVKHPDIHMYDILIFPKPFALTEWALDYICEQEYRGILIVEKLLAKSVKEAEQICERLKNIRFFMFHSRLYAPSFLELPDGKENRVLWPYYGMMDPWYNIVPNYLDEVYQKRQCFPTIKQVSEEDGRLEFTYEKEGCLTIYVDSDKRKKVGLNGEDVEWPNYFISMKLFFEDLEYNRIDAYENLSYEIRLIKEAEKACSLRR